MAWGTFPHLLRHRLINSSRWLLCAAVLLGGCASRPPATVPSGSGPRQAQALIRELLPRGVADRSGWATDLYVGFAALSIEPTRENVCAVVAVVQQESGFRVNPVVPGLGAIARREIEGRAARAGIPRLIVRGALQLKSSSGRTFGDRIDAARTEKELSDIFEDFIGRVPMGRRLFEGANPVRTRGPMQVSLAFAERSAAAESYPYPVKVSIADELFTRRGSLYFGIAHLLGYPAPYDRYLYRFADFNAGQYASRNAAFQKAVSIASGIALIADGALLPHDGGSEDPGSTELAVRTLSARLSLDETSIHRALERADSLDFQKTQLYRRTFALAEQAQGRPLPRASVPHITLHGPKIHRALTTDWYAHRVNGRFSRCLGR
ncbi:MAG: DUF1615 domain-containing protein [Steroidobacteraceae bacterium]